ncbi:carboxylesterase/lipase family protein [Tenggerimyces flavus]|uniref:Carboxylic ester hydrolase n=1 Tax=Tenggerimyces flavus TaxID=1708749 RepID=A0ABV7YKP4_9ACTN|nr:carboxylesterase family protein [Tenggerimyces flavus]MBM7787391.1 para-nitrobenzyl esterase [Tenggerimyces flavus]
MPIRALAVAAAAAIALTTLAASPASATTDPGVVKVGDGWLRGSVAADHVTYSSIPYAAPPVGERRWKPPAAAKSWRGIRDATQPSPLCPQGSMTGATGTEDCLYLDVTVPRKAGKRLPVVVWLYGGGFTSGGAQQYDATRFATAGELIVVTPNYRLGALGFLAAPALGGGGNYGLMDQTAALRWVRENVARFGGDPRNVTLAGQSAGARSVCAHLAAPSSRGLFQRAITQSGACENKVLTPAKAQDFGARATADLGCTTAACLRSVAPERLLPLLNGGRVPVHSRADDRPWGPVAGTTFLPRQPGEAIRIGRAARVPLLLGGTRDEMRGFVSNDAALTEAGYRTMMVETFGAQADVVLAKYPAAAYDSPALALATVLGDWGGFVGACPVLRTAQAAARHQRVYAYEFAEDSRQTEPYPLGAYHSLDLPYLWDVSFPNNFPPLTAEQQELSAQIIDRWAAFAHTGSPNWPSFNRTSTVTGLSAEGLTPTPYGRTHHCDFWAGLPR